MNNAKTNWLRKKAKTVLMAALPILASATFAGPTNILYVDTQAPVSVLEDDGKGKCRFLSDSLDEIWKLSNGEKMMRRGFKFSCGGEDSRFYFIKSAEKQTQYGKKSCSFMVHSWTWGPSKKQETHVVKALEPGLDCKVYGKGNSWVLTVDILPCTDSKCMKEPRATSTTTQELFPNKSGFLG